MNEANEYDFRFSTKVSDLTDMFGTETLAAMRYAHATHVTIKGEVQEGVIVGGPFHGNQMIKIGESEHLPPELANMLLPSSLLTPIYVASPRDADGKVRKFLIFSYYPHDPSGIVDDLLTSVDTMAEAFHECYAHFASMDAYYGVQRAYAIVARDTFKVVAECEADSKDPQGSWSWSTPA